MTTTESRRTFRHVDTRVDFPAMERERLRWWYATGVVEDYLTRNDDSSERWSFLDGPITANNPMGVHHAWGRTYKDLFQRYHTMLGKKQRYQNGFDCQGLWVEVEVERELGFTSKRDIEEYGIADFVEKCKERVRKYALVQTEQTKRLGNFMDWDNSYYTMSDTNNYTIWSFLKQCNERGLIYKGEDSMPWCPRCGTGLSEMELSEGYTDRTHRSIYARLPLDDENASLLIWTTTPWTLPANVAAAVHPELTYALVEQHGERFYLAEQAISHALRGDYELIEKVTGADLVGKTYRGLFDELPANEDVRHKVIPWDDVDAEEGSGIVHIAPGCGHEDYELSKVNDLQIVHPIDELGVYYDGFGFLSGMYAHDVAGPVIESLNEKHLLHYDHDYTHRYATCWRCKTDIVYRVVDEWYIAMDPLRERLQEIARDVRWIPEFGLDRELDWLRNMDDWMISKKRYWGLALPIYECKACGTFEVIGSKEELQERAISGWDAFDGHSPHRPWVDEVKIACSGCGEPVSRITDVGNPWLDAGIVPFSTMYYTEDREKWREWFPADFITESFPGQFRNWFYSMLAQSVVLADEAPYRTVLGFALLRDEHGREMHKSAGNSIPYDEAADRMGSDVMRWLYCRHNPTVNLNFGYGMGDEVRRQFVLPLWNSFAFFTNYASLDGFSPLEAEYDVPLAERTMLDRWIISRLQGVIDEVRAGLEDYDPVRAVRALETYVSDELSNWYIRRNRRRFWKTEADRDKTAAYLTLYEALTTLARLLAPFLPFTTEEIYQHLVVEIDPAAPRSVHLTDYPTSDPAKVDTDLNQAMAALLRVTNLGRAARNKASVKVRQPLPALNVWARDRRVLAAVDELQAQLLDELNVKELREIESPEEYAEYHVKPNFALLGPRFGKQMNAVRGQIQSLDAAAVARAFRAGETVTLEVDGEAHEFTSDEILVDVQEREGFNVAEDGDVLVALDVTLTPELVDEGLARDFVRGVQDARKSAGLKIEDTIRLVYAATGEWAEAIEAHAAYIAGETLATEIVAGDPTGEAFSDDIKVGDIGVTIGLSRVGSLLDER